MRTRRVVAGVLAAAAAAGCAPRAWVVAPHDESVARALVSPRTAEAVYGEMLDALIPQMSVDPIPLREGPQQALERICTQAARPGLEVSRAALCRAMAARLAPQTPRPARVWLLRQLERIGDKEAAWAPAPLLHDDDPELRDAARRALERNPSPAAGFALREALKRVLADAARGRDEAEAAQRAVALIHSLGARGESESVALLDECARQRDAAVAAAAVAALGDVDDPLAGAVLHRELRRQRSAVRAAAAAAGVRWAERQSGGFALGQAGAICQEVLRGDFDAPLRLAALRGVVRTRGEDAWWEIARLMGEDDPRVRAVAARMTRALPGERITRRLAERLPAAEPDEQAVIVDVLAERGGATAHEALVAALDAPSAEVRVAALRALESFGSSGHAARVAGLAARAAGAEREAARRCLARLRGAGVEAALARLLESGEAPERAELIRALAARCAAQAVACALRSLDDEDEGVCCAALEALGALGGSGELAPIAQRLPLYEPEAARRAAEDALAAILARLAGGADAQAEALLASCDLRPADASPALVNVLGRVAGEVSLRFVREVLEGAAGDAPRDAAIRVLAEWKTPEVADDLLRLAREARHEAQRVVALRGYVRLLESSSGLEPAAALARLERVLPLAQRPDDRRLVLAALGRIAHPAALSRAEAFVRDEALRAEAAAAVLSIARRLAATDEQAARAALERLSGAELSMEVRARIAEAREFVDGLDGWLLRWSYSGPYLDESRAVAELFDAPFPPERDVRSSDARGAEQSPEWRPLAVTNPDEPWVFDLARTPPLAGDRRCAYFRTRIWSEREQPARLAIGSDDGVKVWLEGALVHARNVQRAHDVAADQVEVHLRSGWNTLLLKIVNREGAWAFSCGVRAGADARIHGLRSKAD